MLHLASTWKVCSYSALHDTGDLTWYNDSGWIALYPNIVAYKDVYQRSSPALGEYMLSGMEVNCFSSDLTNLVVFPAIDYCIQSWSHCSDLQNIYSRLSNSTTLYYPYTPLRDSPASSLSLVAITKNSMLVVSLSLLFSDSKGLLSCQ